MPSPPVAVAVVSYNTRELLDACLRALAADALGGRAEVWVVDNGSTDGSPERVEERFAWARLVRAGSNLGYGTAVNRVWRATDTPWLAAANADVALEPGALQRLLAAGAADRRAGALAPRLLLPDGSTQHSVLPFPTVGSALVAGAPPGRAARVRRRLCLPGGWDPEAPRTVPWAVGAFLLLRRSALDSVGGFDERLWMYAEDLDLGWRLRRAGWRIRYVPAARALHQESAATGAAWGPRRTGRRQAETYRWMRSRQGSARTAAVALVNAAAAAAAARRPGQDPGRREALSWWAGLHRSTGLRRATLPLR